MKLTSPAFITATLTTVVTTGLIALLFLLPAKGRNPAGTKALPGLKTSSQPFTRSSAKQDVLVRKSSAATLPGTTPAMTLKRLGAIIKRLDSKAENPRKGFWRFTIAGASVIVVSDSEYDRLRILVGIQSAKDLTQDQLMKITKSNFDTALDARYAISQNILWAIYVHPLKSLGGKQFISAVGQTVNLAISYGDGYSSGGILFEGGDEKDARRNHMIEQLIAKGLKA